MSYSQLLPAFTFDLLCYLSRDQLERFSIVCRPLKCVIKRYFQLKPYRMFDRLWICSGSYALFHNGNIQWHPNQDRYNVQQFLAGHSNDKRHTWSYTYYSFAKMRPYLGPTVRINLTIIYVAGDSTYNYKHIKEMESISYLWRDGKINICHAIRDGKRIVAEDFLPILNSAIILQCRLLNMENAHFSFKNYKVLKRVKVIETSYCRFNPNGWPEFLEQPGVKPIVVLHCACREYIINVLDRLSKPFSCAVLPNAFIITFVQYKECLDEFRETNNTSSEILELKKGLPAEYQNRILDKYDNYTLERYSV